MNKQNAQHTISIQNQQTQSPRAIFRPEAVRRYSRQQETIVLPRRVAMRTIVVVWIVFGLLIVSTAGIWMARVPIYLSGDAIIVEQGSPMQRRPVLVAFLPPAARARLAPGQSILVQLDTGGAYSNQTITIVEPEIISPDVARRRYAADAHPPITQPAAVAIAPLTAPEAVADIRATDEHYSVKVRVGTRRLISFLPVFQRTLPEEHR